MIHGDLKPENVVLQRPCQEDKDKGSFPTAKLVDFGICQIDINKFSSNSDLQEMDDEVYQRVKTNPNSKKWKAIMRERSGSGGYMAPEINQSANIVVGPEIDLWAFGIFLYEMSVGYKPQQVPKNAK